VTIDPKSQPRPQFRRASVKDVAAAAEVSLGTVSNVLNRPDRVSPATRERVEVAMAELGFVRNESARSLRAGRSRMLAYVMLDAGNPFFTDVAKGIERRAEASDLALFMCSSDGRGAREAAHLDLLTEQRVHGILITPVDPEATRLAAAAARGIPLVIVDRAVQAEDVCTVAVDDVLGGRLALEHLIQLGHRRVGFVGGPIEIGQVRDRLDGARSAWADAGHDPDDLVWLPTSALNVAEGRSAGERLSAMPAEQRPTAAFCANDLLALGLLQQSIGLGRRVPDDLAIVGYDDIEFAAAAAVPLTSVRQPREVLGQRAAELVLDEADNDLHEHRHVEFDPQLIARASTRPPA
jgi:LacI family transcriptional regulator